jgi:hypothetical protein
MIEKGKEKEFYLKLILWTARVLSALLFIFWGAFFIEHLEYFKNPAASPPPFVYFAMICHFILLASYIFVVWKQLAGSILILVSSGLFFAITAGRNFLPFFIISAVPSFFYLYHWKMSRKESE